MRFAGLIAFGGALGIVGCSLFVSLDGLSGGAEPSVSDAGADVTIDQSSSDDGHVADGGFGADGASVFLDDFNRPDATLLGNDWVEKTASVFSLDDESVLRAPLIDGGANYPDYVVYRPIAEDIADSEISIEVVFSSDVAGFPQIHSRIQENTVSAIGNLDSYLFYIPDGSESATLSRTRGLENLTDLATATLSETLQPGERYRLTLRVAGADPVSLLGSVEHFTSGAWKMIGETTFLDSDPSRLDDAGSTGFSASNGDTDQFRYDNFTRTPL
ncbi:MAG: hypothetical protein ABI183_24175 [Polyangiaceae bacterium]